MSELGSLSHCMMDCDLATLRNTRSVRRKAFVVSTVLELGFLAALLLCPLITPGVLSPRTVVMPLPPFRGLPQTQTAPAHPNQPPATQIEQIRIPIILTPPGQHRRSIPETTNPEPLNLYASSDAGDISQVFPGGGDRGPVIVPPPHASASTTRPLQVSSGVMQGALTYRVEPIYPTIARAIRLEGTVNLRAIIKTDGSVGELTVVDGNPILAQAAMAAVRQWRYRPTLLSGQPVEVETIITVNFVFQ